MGSNIYSLGIKTYTKLEIKMNANRPNINTIEVNPTTQFKPQKQGIGF